MKKPIDIFDYAGVINHALPSGILLNTKGEKVNTMTIGWGQIGTEWGRKIFTVFVRESRYTKKLLEQNPEFTISCPLKAADKKIISYCGTRSGTDTDKIKDMGLTVEAPQVNSVPGFKEFPLTIECKVIYKQDQPKESLEENIQNQFYKNGDYHTLYIGEIVAAYIIE